MNYPEAIAWLASTQKVGIKLGLENTRRLLDLAGVPYHRDSAHRATPASPYIFHIAGTNGKGSVCAMLEAICRAAGLRTALYTSPHLVTYRERIRLDGAMIPEAAVAAGLTRLREATSAWEHPPTFFELTTALALDWFHRERAEVLVLETGMGGRLDSTNAVTPAAAVLTPISFDHAQYLGNTLERIAAEKAGIIKPGIPVVSAPQPEEAARVIAEAAARHGAPLEWIPDPAPYPVALPGSHQPRNAALALAALRVAALPVSEEAAAEGLRTVVWPGRFQQIPLPSGATLVLDGAHNEGAAARLAETWRELYGRQKAILILGVLADKDYPTLCQTLAPLAAECLLTPVANPRSCSPETLVRTLREHAPDLPCTAVASVEEALHRAEAKAATTPAPILLTGSLFLVGETLALLDGKKLEFASAQ